LAAGVAHEINNPNALILLNAPILAEAFSDVEPILEDYFEENGDFPVGRLGYQRMRDELPRLLDGINGSARRIKRIVEDLKDFVRQDNDTFDEQIDLNAVVQAAVRLVGNVIKKSTHRFSAEYTSGLPPLHGHAQGIEQVVVNLIVNACQALPAPDCSIVVTTGCDAGRGEVFCEVRDEGSGIAPENLPFLTDPFFTTRREEGGTGLGLSVSARIVKEHDGSLVFDSQPGSGTIVTLAFPVKEERTS
ncbi:MAG TPA: ATP-binding protein, partial [Desulfuromonadales bacterium]|nr:ATP-binding protein [Desulfuromonadales bacterium]